VELEPEDKRHIMYGVAKGMEHIASAGFIHRDLAARNVLVSITIGPDKIKSYVPKISDFGSATLARPHKIISSATSTSGGGGGGVTAAAAAGTSSRGVRVDVFSADATDVRQCEYDLGYGVDQNITATKWAAPEVLDLLWSEASDVWSFGVTCYELWANGAEPGIDAETTLAALRRGQCHRARPSQTLFYLNDCVLCVSRFLEFVSLRMRLCFCFRLVCLFVT
jgi:serine/threonine protein kinase